MRNITILALGVSTMALSGCSLFSGWGGNSHNNSINAPYGQSNSAGVYNPGSACCSGGNQLSKWNLEAELGTEATLGGTLLNSSRATLPAGLIGASVRDIDMDDAYNPALRASLGTSYALSPTRKITGTVSYTKADSNRRTIGNFTGAAGGSNYQLTPSTYESLGLEAGLRQYFQPKVVGQSFGYRPYVEGRIGAAKVKDINVTTTSQGVVSAPSRLYNGGWVPTGAALIGVETPVFNRATIGLETGVRYAGELDRASSANVNLAAAADDGSRWSIPVTLRGRYRF